MSILSSVTNSRDHVAFIESEVRRVFDLQTAHRSAMAETDASGRIAWLRRIRKALLKRKEDIRAAMWADFKKPAREVDLTEIFPISSEIKFFEENLARWMQPHSVDTPTPLLGSSSWIRYEPRGSVLIISPWNFPFNLTFGPLATALAAGNTVVLKPSELTPHCSALMKDMIGELFDEQEVALLDGDHEMARELLRLPFDHIFFTGSPRVGKLVMHAAAEHLTSVTLELGGKSPAIVDATANIGEAARKIAWGKFVNAGQTCIAPDYVLVHRSVQRELLDNMKAAVARMYGNDEAAIRSSESFARVVDERHAARLDGLLRGAIERGAKAECGGNVDLEERFVAPTILSEVDPASDIMEEEIFGPVLPVLAFDDLDQALALINAKPKPLALYVFSKSKAIQDKVLRQTRAGGTCINDTLVHFFQLNLPFGGSNNSGMGQSHGFFGFKTFSHARGVLQQQLPYGATHLMYPPYTNGVGKMIDLSIKLF